MRGGKLSSVGGGVLAVTMSPVRATAGNQIETVEKIEEMSVGAG